jgi:hypothetical protein
MDEQHAEAFMQDEVLRCAQCGELATLAPGETPSVCPHCGGVALERVEDAVEVQDVPGTAVGPAVEEPRRLPVWMGDPHALLGEPGEYICFEDGEEVVVVPLTREWTRIGRSLAADVRFDDPTVSRRHALIVRGPDGVRVLDDRSLNGVFVNGKRVEWSPLSHGDEIRVGRHRLYYATLEQVPASAAESTA